MSQEFPKTKVSMNVSTCIISFGIIDERKIVESKAGAKFRLHFVRKKEINLARYLEKTTKILSRVTNGPFFSQWKLYVRWAWQRP